MDGTRAGPRVDVDAWQGERGRGAAVLAGLLLAFLAASWVPPAVADPAVAPEGGAIRRATWDFTDAGDYQAENVTLAAGGATLAEEARATTYATDAAFTAARLEENRTTVRAGVRLAIDGANLVADGTFDGAPGPWSYADGPLGEVRAVRDGSRARIGHLADSAPFDALEDIAAWYPVRSTLSQSTLALETTVVHGGLGSLRDQVFVAAGGYAGAGRDDAGSWDWSAYTHVAAWAQSSASLSAYVRLRDANGTVWDCNGFLLTSGWSRLLFPIAAFPGDLSAVDSVEVRFDRELDGGGIVYLDDLVLLRVRPFDEAASVSQAFWKPATSGAAGGVALAYDVEASAAVGVTASLEVSVGGIVVASESPVPAGARPVVLDVGGIPALRGEGSYRLSFALRLTRTGAEEASMDAWIDNVTVLLLEFVPGSFTAKPMDAGAGVRWTAADVAAIVPAGTSVGAETRTGNTSQPSDGTWSPWAAAAGAAIASPPGRYLQWRLRLATTNGTKTPIATRLAVTEEGYAPRGTVVTAPFLPTEPLVAWRRFLANHTTPLGTSVGYELSFDGGPWVPVAHGQDLGAYRTVAVRVRATLATGDPLATPALASFSIRFEVLGAIATIVLDPANATIAWGDSVAFTAIAQDAYGHALPLACLWSTDDPGGRVTGDGTAEGTYASGGAGTWTVRCTSSEGAANGTATVVVRSNPLGRIEVSPGDATVTADETLQFTATGYDVRNHSVPVRPAWAATGGAIDDTGRYTPSVAGRFNVTATQDDVVGTARVSVLVGHLARIDVAPPTATITADDVLQLAATGRDGSGNEVAASFAWAATCGSVNGTGAYAPTVAGACVVYANASGVSGRADVTVLAGALARLAIAPEDATITADDTLPFVADGFDAKGNAVAVTPTWGAEQGTIAGDGVYAPTYAGVWRVWAEAGGRTTSTHVTVLPGRLARLDVNPAEATVRADEVVVFHASGFDRAGNPVPADPSWSSTNGTVEGGAFLPFATGTWAVNATQDGVVGSATVVVLPGSVVRVVVTPGAAHLKEGESATFTAVAYDGKGNEIPDAAFAWRVEGDVGTVAAGVFRAARGGHGGVVASAAYGTGSAEGSASVDVEGSPLSSPVLYVGLTLVPIVLSLVAFLRQRRRIAKLRARLAAHERPTPRQDGPADGPGSEGCVPDEEEL